MSMLLISWFITYSLHCVQKNLNCGIKTRYVTVGEWMYKYRRSRVLLLKMNTKTSKQKNVKKKIKNLLKSYLNVFVNCAKTTFEISLWYPDLKQKYSEQNRSGSRNTDSGQHSFSQYLK